MSALDELRALDVPCQCGVEPCIYPVSIAFACERCARFVPACFGGCDPETGEADELCDDCYSLVWRTCGPCNGTGMLDDQTECFECGGVGEVRDE